MSKILAKWLDVDSSQFDIVEGQPLKIKESVLGTSSSSGEDFLSMYKEVVQVSAAFSITACGKDKFYKCSASTSQYTINLPTSELSNGDVFAFFGMSDMLYPVTLDAGSGITIAGSQTRYLFFDQYLLLRWDGSNWEILNNEHKLKTDRTFNVATTFPQTDLTAIIDACPKNLNGYALTFQLADGTHTGRQLYFTWMQGGAVYVKGNMGESGLHSNQAVYIDNSGVTTGDGYFAMFDQSSILAVVVNIKVQCCGTYGGAGGVHFLSLKGTGIVQGCYVKCDVLPPNGTYPIAVDVGDNSYAKIMDNYFEQNHLAIHCVNGGHSLSLNNPPIGTSNKGGLLAYNGGVISKSGTQPSGGEQTWDGGVIR